MIKNPSSINSSPKVERFHYGIYHKVCDILLVGSFHPLVPYFSASFLIPIPCLDFGLLEF